MAKMVWWAPVAAATMLGACSGGGNDSGAIAVPAPTPTLSVTLAPTATAQTATETDSTASFSVQAAYAGSATTPIVAQFAYDTTLLAPDGDVTVSGSSYTQKFKTKSGLSAQAYSSDISFRLCTDSACGTVYPGSSQKFTYSLDVKLSDWTTRQRNAAHNGYVHAAFDLAKFVKSWEYGGPSTAGFLPVAAREGTVFATVNNSDGSQTVAALNAATGAERWHYSLGNRSYVSGPALDGSQLAVSTMFSSSGNNPLVVLDADGGTFVRNLPFPAQWSNFAQPTYFKGGLFIATGYYGNEVYAFDKATGARNWVASGSGGHTWDGEAPAVDDSYVYYYSGNLDVYDRTTGALV